MSPPNWSVISAAGLAVGVLAGMMAVFRLVRLKSRGALTPEMATYYQSLTGSLRFKFRISGLDQTTRMAQGRALRLLYSRDHHEIGDPLLSGLVGLQRASVLIFALGTLAQVIGRVG